MGRILGLEQKIYDSLGDGMADYPVAELGGKTPLQAAQTPNLDRFSPSRGRSGWCVRFPRAFLREAMWPTFPSSATTRRSTSPVALPWRRLRWESNSAPMTWPFDATF